jgi:hypothetical protein
MGIFHWLVSGDGSEGPRWLRRWVLPRPERDGPKLDQIKRAAAEDDAVLEENRKYFRQDIPGEREDDL